MDILSGSFRMSKRMILAKALLKIEPSGRYRMSARKPWYRRTVELRRFRDLILW
jgi:hypothetical protein